METVSQESFVAALGRETWSFDDYRKLLDDASRSPGGPHKLRAALGALESANPQPKGLTALKIGMVRYILCRPAEALQVLADATDNKERRYFQGLSHKALRQYDKAGEEFDRAKDRGWDAAEIDVLLVECQALRGDLEAAAKALARLEGKIGGRADCLYLRGLIDDLSGLHEKAADSYEKALAVDPTHPGATFHLAYYFDLHGEEARALELYRKCTSRPPLQVSALLNLAVLYEDLGQYEKACGCLETILQYNPIHPRARLFLKDASASTSMFFDEEQAKRIARRNAVLDIPVTDFELSVRARNCLKKMNIRTLGDLVRTTEAELLAYKNFGETSLKEIKDMLTAKGLHLGQAMEGEEEQAFAALPSQPPQAPANEGVRATSVDGLEFSIRCRRALQALNVRTLGDLADKTEPELLACRNFGQTSLNEVRQRLAEYGLQLRE